MTDGNFYWLSQSDVKYYGDPSYSVGMPQSGVIRNDWLIQLGLPMPATVDEFYNTLLAFPSSEENDKVISIYQARADRMTK
jgi:hypothetical protein